jgi:hypothetical protein
MALLGNLIKKGVELNQRLLSTRIDPVENQEEQLRELISAARKTSFGKYYNFNSLLASKDIVAEFKERVPIHEYEKIHNRWWEQQQKQPDITWPGKPDFFALSSGTTGKSSKRIPVTEEFLDSMRKVGTSLIRSLPNFDFPEELFESEILMLSSSANLIKNDRGHLEGEISGINVSNFPGWYDFFYRPGKEIAKIDDWDERVEAIAKEAPNWNIGAIAGIPSWVYLMLKKVIEYNKLDTIHDIWPNLTAYASGGVAFDTYRSDFEKISGKPLTIIDTYLASEGFFAYTSRPNTMSMQLALNHGYFYEFIPFDESGVDATGQLLENPVSIPIQDVELEKEYVLVISSCAGAWRYAIGDTIKFTNLDPHEIVLTGRTKFFLNVVGSQLSEEKLDQAVIDVSEELGISINEYSVAAIKNADGNYIHQWVVVTDHEVDEDRVARELDRLLKEANKNYTEARNKALYGVRARAIRKTDYLKFLEKDKKIGGQIKTPKVMKEEKMCELLKILPD